MKSKEGMDIAKKLYYYGLISNPITESQKYKDEELVGPKILVEYFQDFKIFLLCLMDMVYPFSFLFSQLKLFYNFYF